MSEKKQKRNGWLKLLAASGLVGSIVAFVVTGSTGNPMAGAAAGKVAEQLSDSVIEHVVDGE
jgi:hypothetical protein